MNSKNFLVGGIIGGIVYFFLGWLFYGILLYDVFAIPQEMADMVQYGPEEMKMSFMIISCLAWGIFVAFVFDKWAGISTFTGGLKGGAIIGAFVSLSVGASMLSMFKFGSATTLLIDMVTNALCTGITGGVIGWYLGRK